MHYIRHKSDDGENREQALIEHLNGTSALCSEFAKRFTMEEIGKLLGLYHDVGKYSIGFQKRIQQNGPKVDHSTAGAQLLGKYFVPFAFCIAGHHSGLMNLGVRGDIDNGTLVARMRKKLEGILDYSAFKNELPELSVNKKLFPAFSDTFSAMFFTRMLFSCLVDADFLDTERFMRPNTLKRGEFSDLEELYKRYNAYIMAWGNPTNKLNEKRTEIREECINAAHGQEGIYTLTVPTGGGKTIASLGFALEHAMQHKNKERIIYVIPYTSIIEQTADVFRSIVGSENVVEHHMNADYDDAEFGDEKQKENERKKLATENWDAPIIVTTNVQFFESLYGNKTSRCRKLHNIANSIVILDEAQMLPNDYLIPCMRAIRELVSNYHVTAVLCTATQPSLNKYFTEDVQLHEICSNVDDLYDFFRRVHYEKTDFEDTEALVAQLNIHKQVLCIVNSKKAAQKIFDGLNGDGCYHLSTFMYPQHRRKILAEVRERLKNNLPCKLVATSLVEAGVDVDFPVVYREIAGLDSIIQAAGRCNRENKRPLEESIVYIFEIENDDTKIPSFIRLPREITQMVMRDFNDISSTAAIKKYFDQLHVNKGESLDMHNILGMSDKRMLFKDIASDFKIIGETGRGVFIPCDDASKKLLEQLRAGVRNRSLMRKAGQYIVNVYENQFLKLQGAGVIDVVDENINVLADMSIYDVHKGLIVNIDDGVGVFF